MKKYLALALALVMVFALCACGQQAAPAAQEAAPAAPAAEEAVQEAVEEVAAAGKPGPYKFGLMLYSSSDEATLTIRNGVEKAAEAAGVELVIADNGADPTKTPAILENMLTQEVDAIIDATWDAAAGLTTSQKCKEEGIPLFTCDVEYDDYAHLVGANNYGSGLVNGEYAAQWINENWDGEVDYVLILCYQAGGEGVRARCQGSVDKLEELGIKVGEVVEFDNVDTAKTKTTTTDFLTAHPDAHKIFICPNNDSGALGAYNAALTMDREADCCIVSYNADSFALEHFATVEDSCWKGTVNFNLGGYGDIAVPALCDILATGTDNYDHELNTQTFVIDRTNVAEYYSK